VIDRAPRRRQSLALLERGLRVIPDACSRDSIRFDGMPYVASGDGCVITSADGERFVDYANNMGSLIHGSAHPAIVAAVSEQLRRGSAFALPSESEIALAELLCERVPSFEQVKFVASGSEAVMAAIKAARAMTGRSKIAKCEGAFHGTYDYVEVSYHPTPELWGDCERPRSVGRSPATPKGVVSDVVVLPFNHPRAAAELLRVHADELAAVVIDPMPNRLGLIEASDEFLLAVREATSEFGIWLIFDEVITFRMGYGGAQGVYGVTPDLTALGKLIGGGFPIGAVAGPREFMQAFGKDGGSRRVPHSGTFSANPISMVAGRAALELMTPEEFGRLNALGDQARGRLADLLRSAGTRGQVTGRGSMMRIHLWDGPMRDYRTAYPSLEAGGAVGALRDALLERGVLISGTGMLCLSTPMGEAEIDDLSNKVSDALSWLRESAVHLG
jgi:glutamate-1-semialdehyde 2,1-aminomutase